MMVMAITDFLTLHFFWVVRDEGSWLEIGSTISHFVIASLLCMFVASLEGVSEMFIAGVEVEDGSSQISKEKELGGDVVETEKLEKSEQDGHNAASTKIVGVTGEDTKPVVNGVGS